MLSINLHIVVYIPLKVNKTNKIFRNHIKEGKLVKYTKVDYEGVKV